jgi:hypothetical protein
MFVGPRRKHADLFEQKIAKIAKKKSLPLPSLRPLRPCMFPKHDKQGSMRTASGVAAQPQSLLFKNQESST